jgi:hypothetical protein
VKIKEKILSLFNSQKDLTIKEITDSLLVSKQAVHLAINQLVELNQVTRLGRTPKTIYRLNTSENAETNTFEGISEENKQYLKNQFLLITEIGNILEGVEAFAHWCKQRKLPLEKTIGEFIVTKQKYQSFYNNFGLINGNEKLKSTKGYDKIFLDDVIYLDFYAIERFGKTRLGTLLHYAKQGQNKYLMNILVNEIREKIEEVIKSSNFDAVGFIPPTIRREVQLMKFIETQLKLNLPKIKIQKISGIIPVPQKSLNKLEERINNAENTFTIPEKIKYNKVLLIDDAIGSGSTLNQIAGKIKQKGIAKSVTGLAVVGSFKGFDVITDV